MSESDGKNDFDFEGDSTATLDPVDASADPGLLDKLAKQLNAIPIKAETVDLERMQQLETRLADREQLVSILTDRLEQAAAMQHRFLRETAKSPRNSTASSTPGKNATKALPCVEWKRVSKNCENGSNRQRSTGTSRPVTLPSHDSHSATTTNLKRACTMKQRSTNGIECWIQT